MIRTFQQFYKARPVYLLFTWSVLFLFPMHALAQNWTGSVQCTLNEQDPAYNRQETQTWTLAGAPTLNGNTQVYPATWTVKGTGQLLKPQGTQSTNIIWQSDAQGQASIAFIIRASDGRLMVMTRHARQSVNGGTNVNRQVTVNGVAQPPTPLNHAVFEWVFPHIEASPNDTTITGSGQSPTEGLSAELVHRYGVPAPNATCQWNFTKGGAAQPNSNPTGMGGSQNSNQQNSQPGNSGGQNNNQNPPTSSNPTGMGGGTQNSSPQPGNTGGQSSNSNCDSPATVQQSFEAMKANIKSSYDTLIQGTTDQTQIASLTQQEQKTLAGLTAQEQHDMQTAAADGCTGAGHGGNAQGPTNTPTGSTSTGGGQNSTTSSQQQTTPPPASGPSITSITPAQANCGQITSFQVTGANTHFASGATTADFGPGMQQMTFSVTGPTSFYAHMYTHAAAMPGAHTVTVTTGNEVVTTTFTVNSPCNPGQLQASLYLSQNAGAQGAQNLVVQLSGQAAQRAYFVQGITTADFGPGITANLTVNSPTSATAVLSIDPSAPTGPRDVSLNTAGELVTASQGFTVTPGANSAPPLVNLTISYIGNGTGQVTVAPAGTSCGANCMQYPSGTNLTAVATPANGSKFMAFGGGVCATTNPCSFSITTATTLTGIFHLGDATPPAGPVNLTATSSGNGSGNIVMTPAGSSCGTNCMQYSPGTTVMVIAAPSSGSTFNSFNGGGCGSTNPCSLTITAATTVTATFSLNGSSGGSTGSTGSTGLVAGTPNKVTVMSMLTGVSPTTNSGQSNVTVTLTGQGTHFATGSTKVSFARSATQLNSISAQPANAALQSLSAGKTSPPALQAGQVQAPTATTLTVPVTMNPATTAGSYDITVTTPISGGTETVALKNVFTVTNAPPLTGVNINPPVVSKNIGSSTPPAPASAKYRVVISGLMCMRHVSSDDAIYAAAVVRQYDRRNNQNTMFTNLNTWVYGDINGRISQRKQAGTRGPLGGIGDGDLVPTGFMPGIRDTMPTPQVNNLLPLTLWEGTLTDGVDALVISPSLWINYGDNPLFSTWNQNQDSFTNSILLDSRAQNQINTQTLGTLVLGPGANVSGSVAQAVVHDAATIILDTVLVIPFVELQGGPSHDRPVGLVDTNPSDRTSPTILPNTTLVLTREMIEKRLGSNSWMMMPIDLNDTAHSFTGLIGADQPGEYQMFIQIERQ